MSMFKKKKKLCKNKMNKFQETRMEEDLTYQLENVRSEKQHFLIDSVKEKMESVFKKHGALYFSPPLLLPQNNENKKVETKVKLMTHSGSIVNLPYDLRISFARYLACKPFTRLRRYAVEKVYKEKKVHGLHPKEQYECAFDIVAPSRCMLQTRENFSHCNSFGAKNQFFSFLQPSETPNRKFYH